MLTATQADLFRRELRAAVRNADKRTAKGRVVTDVCLALLDNGRALEELWHRFEAVPTDEATRRRIHQQGYKAGYDAGFNDGLGE